MTDRGMLSSETSKEVEKMGNFDEKERAKTNFGDILVWVMLTRTM